VSVGRGQSVEEFQRLPEQIGKADNRSGVGTGLELETDDLVWRDTVEVAVWAKS